MQAHHSSKELEDIIKECFELAKDVDPDEGKIADYIPQLGQVNPELYGVSFCDMHGRLYNLGDTSQLFCLQSLSKPMTYMLARVLEEEQSQWMADFESGFTRLVSLIWVALRRSAAL